MSKTFTATSGIVVRPEGDGTLVDNVFLSDLLLDAIFQYATYLEKEFPG